MMTLEKFEEASELVKKVTNPTKLIYSEYLSAQTGAKVYLKPENMQHTGAYKIRGAYYKISTLTDEERSRGLITASAGNHAQGVAFAAKQFGCKATIVMPTVTPLIKVNRTKSFGADVVLHGDVYDDAYAYACKLAEENGYTFVHPFNDLDVATGQGTIAMEIVQELPTVDYILAPIGGGGLITGVSTLAKMLNPKIKVIGVEPSEAASMTAALKAGEPVELPSYGRKPQDDCRKFRTPFRSCIKADGHQRKESSLCIKWWKYGCNHNVLYRTARTDSERPYLLRIRTPSG